VGHPLRSSGPSAHAFVSDVLAGTADERSGTGEIPPGMADETLLANLVASGVDVERIMAEKVRLETSIPRSEGFIVPRGFLEERGGRRRSQSRRVATGSTRAELKVRPSFYFANEFAPGRTATDRPSHFETQRAEGMSEDEILGELFEAMHPDEAGAVYESYNGDGDPELQDSLAPPEDYEGAHEELPVAGRGEVPEMAPRGNTPVSTGDGGFSDGGLDGTSPRSARVSVSRGGGTPTGSVRSMNALTSSHIGAHHAQPWESAMAVSANSPSNKLPASRGSMRQSSLRKIERKDPYLASPAISPKPKPTRTTQNASHVRSASQDMPYSPPMTRSRVHSRAGSEYGGSQGSAGSGGSNGFVSLKRQVEAELKAQADERWRAKKTELDTDREQLEMKLERLQLEKGLSKTDAELKVLKLKPWEQSKRNREFDERIARNQAEREEVDKLMAANRARRQKAQVEHDEWKMKFEAAERKRKVDQEFALQAALKQQTAELWEHRAQKERADFKEKCMKDTENALKKKLWKEDSDRISLDKEERMKRASYRAPPSYDIEPVGKKFQKSKPFRRQIREALAQRERAISSAGSVENIRRDHLGKYNTRSPSAAGASRSGTAFDRAPTFGMTGRHDTLTQSLLGNKSRGSAGVGGGSHQKMRPNRFSSGGSDYASDDYLRNKDEHGLTRDDLDDLGYHNNPHAQYDD